MGTVIERQVIVTWYTPEEKLPPEFTSVVATISGRAKNVIYDHAMIMMEYASDSQWARNLGVHRKSDNMNNAACHDYETATDGEAWRTSDKAVDEWLDG